MKVEVEVTDELTVAQLKDSEALTLRLIGKKIVPCTDTEFTDLYDYFKQLRAFRYMIEYYGGEYCRPFLSPNSSWDEGDVCLDPVPAKPKKKAKKKTR